MSIQFFNGLKLHASTHKHPEMTDAEALSDYEIRRLERIKRNQQKLAELGLTSAAAVMKADVEEKRAKTSSTASLDPALAAAAEKAKDRKRKRLQDEKRKRAEQLAAMPRRRSKRQRGEKPEIVGESLLLVLSTVFGFCPCAR